MKQDTTQKEWAIGCCDSCLETRPHDEAVVIPFGDNAIVADRRTIEGEEETSADDTQGDHSTVSTGWYHDGEVSCYRRANPLLETETNPTSLPSGIPDELDLERKCTGSPLNSMEAAHGSDSAISEASDSPTGASDLSQHVPTTVNPGKVEAIGGHFDECSTEASPPRFHDPNNSWEAIHINNKIKQANGNPAKSTVSQTWPDLFLQKLWMILPFIPGHTSAVKGPRSKSPHDPKILPNLLLMKDATSSMTAKYISYPILYCSST